MSEGRRRFGRLFSPATAGLVGLVGAATACGPPTLFDTELRPVREPAFVLPVPHGWAAVDTASERPRGVLELSLEADHRAVGERWAVPVLECPAKHLHRADRARRDGPHCLSLRREWCQKGEGCGAAVDAPDRCIYLIRAEYWLGVSTVEGDTLTLVTNRWRASRVLRSR